MTLQAITRPAPVGLDDEITPELLWDYKTASMHTGFTVKSLQHRVARRSIPFVKFGRSIRFIPEKLDRWRMAHYAPTLDELSAHHQALTAWHSADVVLFLDTELLITSVLESTPVLEPGLMPSITVGKVFPRLPAMLRSVRPTTVLKEFEFIHKNGCLLARVVRPSRHEVIVFIRRP